jgi:hypothetical protein
MFSGSKYYWTGAEEQGSPTTNPQPACWPTLPGNNYKQEKYNSFPNYGSGKVPVVYPVLVLKSLSFLRDN